MYEESKEARGMIYTGLETYVQQAAFDQTLTRLYGAEGAEKAHSRCMEVTAATMKRWTGWNACHSRWSSSAATMKTMTRWNDTPWTIGTAARYTVFAPMFCT